MCDNVADEYSRIMNKIRDMMNWETPVDAIDASSDGNGRWQCPICDTWWYGTDHNYCHHCGHRIAYR